MAFTLCALSSTLASEGFKSCEGILFFVLFFCYTNSMVSGVLGPDLGSSCNETHNNMIGST